MQVGLLVSRETHPLAKAAPQRQDMTAKGSQAQVTEPFGLKVGVDSNLLEWGHHPQSPSWALGRGCFSHMLDTQVPRGGWGGRRV